MSRQDSKKHPVIELILDRARSGSQPLRRDDGFKLGLAIEGGSMRGVVSAGMVTALEYLQLLNVFDSVYGSSAGAFNGAFFVARQAAYGTTIYYENINNKAFISFRRFLSREPIVKIEYLVENILIKEKVLDWKAVLDSRIPLNVVVSSLNELGAKVLNSFETKDELLIALHASSKMPLIAGSPVELAGDRFLDASVFEAIPFPAACKDDCTHVLVLLTRPRGQLKEPNFLDRLYVARKLDKLTVGLGQCYLNSNRVYNETISAIRDGESNPREQPYVLPISLPEGHTTLRKTEKNERRLVDAAMAGMKAVFSAINGESSQLTKVLTPFDKFGHICRPPWVASSPEVPNQKPKEVSL